MGDLSPHFSAHEFRCHGFGVKGHPDHQTSVDVVLLGALERLRAAVGRPLVIVSGHRCPWWNARQKGAKNSQHLYGRAADLRYGVVAEALASSVGFHGIGVKGPYAVHVDVRPGPRARWHY